HAHGVIEVGALHLLYDGNGLDVGGPVRAVNGGQVSQNGSRSIRGNHTPPYIGKRQRIPTATATCSRPNYIAESTSSGGLCKTCDNRFTLVRDVRLFRRAHPSPKRRRARPHDPPETAVEGRKIAETGIVGDRRDRIVRDAQPDRRAMQPGL